MLKNKYLIVTNSLLFSISLNVITIIFMIFGSVPVSIFAFLGLKDPNSKIRGMKFSFSLPEESEARYVVPTFHPSYTLYYRSSTDIVASDIKFSLTLLG